jgi:hypothetical protein
MLNHNLDVKFWKTLTTYSFSLGFGYRYMNKILNQTDFIDLAV